MVSDAWRYPRSIGCLDSKSGGCAEIPRSKVTQGSEKVRMIVPSSWASHPILVSSFNMGLNLLFW